jgi:ribA/ribD-fused uncharacterized protein
MKQEKLPFGKQKGFEFLSNMYPCQINYNGYIFPSSENLYQFLKIPEKLQKDYINIYLNISPQESKKLSKINPIRKEWNKIRINIMYNVLKLKFDQNLDLKEKLLKIEGPIVEWNNWNDKFWGKDLKTNEGKNWLGILLMRLREEYKGLF